MKKIFCLLLFVAAGLIATAQELSDFFYHPGVQDLAFCAHPTNTYDHGSYSVGEQFVTVDIFYKDQIHTRLFVRRGVGSLYFSGITVDYDNDIVSPFLAFGLGTAMMMNLEKKSDPQQYNTIKQDMINLLGSNPENWNGRDWTLFALNLEYVSGYLSK